MHHRFRPLVAGGAWRLIITIVAACAVVLSTSCSSGDDDAAVGDGDAVADEGEDASLVRLAEYQIVRGIQLRLVAAHSGADELTVVLEASSGSLHAAEVDFTRARLATNDRDGIEPTRSSGRVTLESGDDTQVEITFPVREPVESFDLEVPRPFAVADNWEFEDVRLDEERRPELPEQVVLGHRRSHPQGTQLELRSMAFTESRIGLSVVVRNGGVGGVYFVMGDDTYLEDGLGNRYLSVPPDPDDPGPIIEAGTEMQGVLSFAGALAPEATSLSIGINTGMGASLDGSLTPKPAFVIDDVAIDGSHRNGSAIQLPGPLELEVTKEHPSGVTATLRTVTFEETTVQASAELVNPNAHDVEIQPSISLVDSVITDDLGNEYELLPPDDPDAAPVIMVPGTSRIDTELAFAGRIADDASSFRLALNEGTKGAATGRTTRTPTFVWESLSVPERSSATDAAEAEDLIVSARSELGEERLDRSSAEVVARTVAEFDGSETADGVLLVVPERVLFDFGSHALRADAMGQLADLAGVLEFYARAPVAVVGHTDSIGSTESNQALSERRAAAVADALTEFGVERSRITASGRGEEEPIAPNERPDGSDDPVGRQENRRVEVLVRTDEPIPEG